MGLDGVRCVGTDREGVGGLGFGVDGVCLGLGGGFGFGFDGVMGLGSPPPSLHSLLQSTRCVTTGKQVSSDFCFGLPSKQFSLSSNTTCFDGEHAFPNFLK